MLAYLFCFLLGSVLGFLAIEFADRWGCSKRYHSPLPKEIIIAFLCGIGAALLYWQEWKTITNLWETEGFLIPGFWKNGTNPFVTYWFSLHIIFFTFLLAATLTDFYETIIPDSITVTGTIAALLLAVYYPVTSLPTISSMHTGYYAGNNIGVFCAPLNVWSPNFFPIHEWRASTYTPNDFIILLSLITLLWWFWCFAMLDRVWYAKLPFRKAHAIFWRYLYRSPRTKYMIAAALMMPLLFVGSVGAAEIFLNNIHSGFTLISSLVGMVTGMVLIWSIRLVSRYILGVEAMGFGDVTLMGMIGAFLGWQAALLIFFIAPFFGLIYGIFNLLLGKGRAVPYGPFLCLATVFVVVFWSPIWSATAEYFAFGIGIIGLGLLVLLFLFAGLLHMVHKIIPPQ